MDVIGIICEYNPFHNGHVYHLNKIKEMYPDSIIVLVLGGYFLERGDISLISKWNKTKIALDYGVNIVMELPAIYNTNSADIFAHNSINILNSLGVSKIVFGSESADVETLKKIAHLQNDLEFNKNLKENLKSGFNYPTSISKSLGINLESNDILGVAYIKAIEDINPSIEPITIKRTNKYDDIEADDKIVSASNIREKIKNDIDITKHIPSYDINVINEIDCDKMFELLKYRILTENHLERFLGVDEGLENKIKKEITEVYSLEELIDAISSKRYTKSRLKRMLLHILLGFLKEDVVSERKCNKILGFDAVGSKYLRKLNSTCLSTNPNDYISELEKRTANIYYILTKDESVKYETLNKPIIKK